MPENIHVTVKEEHVKVTVAEAVIEGRGPAGPPGESIVGPPGTTDYNELQNTPSLSTVALTGTYDDLTNKPTIPDVSGKADTVYVDTQLSEKADISAISNVPNVNATQRSNHTGTQPISTVTGLQNQLDAKQSEIMVNVRDYGATGDGVTDDTSAIQAAIDLASTTGGTVFAPRGVYLINGTLNIPSSIKLMGSGMDNGTSITGTTFRRTVSTGSPMLSVTGAIPGSNDAVSATPVKRVTLSDFTLRASSSDTLLRMFYTNRNNVARVRFIGTSGHAVHGIEFWDTTFDACTFDFTGSATKASIYLQNRSTSTAGEMGYSNDNCNRLSFRGCTWESYTSKCIEMEGATNGSTHLMNNITIDDCKFETSTFQNPHIQTGASVASVYIKDSYFASNAGSLAKPQIQLGGSSASVKDCRFYQGEAGIVECAIKLDGHAGQNTIDAITCNWLGSAPTSTAAVSIGIPVTPSEDSVTNIKANTGKKVVDATAYSSFRAVQALTATADQEPSLVWEQTGTNPKKIKLGITASGNFSMQPDNGALWTIKKPDNSNFAAFDMTSGRVGIGTVTPAVPLEVVGEARVSTAGTNAASVVTVGGTQTLTNKSLTAPTITGSTTNLPTTFVSGGNTVTFPGASTTIVGRSTVDTLSNKTLTSPMITSGNVPASATAPGTAGQIQWDSNYIYVCVAANTWKRTALSTW